MGGGFGFIGRAGRGAEVDGQPGEDSERGLEEEDGALRVLVVVWIMG